METLQQPKLWLTVEVGVCSSVVGTALPHLWPLMQHMVGRHRLNVLGRLFFRAENATFEQFAQAFVKPSQVRFATVLLSVAKTAAALQGMRLQ